MGGALLPNVCSLTWLTTASVEWNALLTILAPGMWQTLCQSQYMPLLSIKDLAVAISTRAGPAEDDPPLYKLGSKPVQAVCKGESEALN